MEVYYDNAATTRVYPEVRDIMLELMEVEYGNPSSMHTKGVSAELYVKGARESISRCLKCDAKEIIFTSGGTESNNMALFGLAHANMRRGKRIITTPIEHASVYNPIVELERQGYMVDYVGVDSKGIVNISELKEMLTKDTVLVSVMAVNNEIGAVEPVGEIADTIKAYNRDNNAGVLFHVDAVQAFGKQTLYPKRLGIDAMSVSGHKIHGPKGSGLLYVRDGVRITPLIYGGGQERGLRSGTENTAAIAGLGKAFEIVHHRMDANIDIMNKVKKELVRGMLALEGVTDNSGEAPHIASLSFEGIRSEVLLHALEDKGIYVSAGSACSSNHPAISGVLKAIGVRDDLLESTLRFSFSEYNTVEEVDYTIGVIREVLPILRRFTRK